MEYTNETELKTNARDAIAAGERFFYSTEPCAAGHLSKRYSKGGYCIACQQLRYSKNGLTKIKGKKRKFEITPITHAKKIFCVYAISCEGFVKIGVTRFVENRLIQIKVNCPYPARLEYKSDNMFRIDATDIESAALSFFHTEDAHGEWVRASPEDVIKFISERVIDS
jgi:hypothetical protein